jgi:hypothetical protein
MMRECIYCKKAKEMQKRVAYGYQTFNKGWALTAEKWDRARGEGIHEAFENNCKWAGYKLSSLLLFGLDRC